MSNKTGYRPVTNPVEDYEPARPSDFEAWWSHYGRYIKPNGSDSYEMESYRERLAQASWEAKQ